MWFYHSVPMVRLVVIILLFTLKANRRSKNNVDASRMMKLEGTGREGEGASPFKKLTGLEGDGVREIFVIQPQGVGLASYGIKIANDKSSIEGAIFHRFIDE